MVKSLIIILIVCLIGFFRFDGLKSIVYESSDPATHYRHANIFSEELSMLNRENSKVPLYGGFQASPSMYYINMGFLFNILNYTTT